jgi:hypothetical protein
MNYTVTTSPDIGSGSENGVPNGTYSVPVSGLGYETTYQWDISVTDGDKVINKSYSFTTEKEPGPWWDCAWVYRKAITIDHTKVAEDLNNFPVLIAIDDSSLLSNVQDDADDIAFTDYDGVPLNHEVENYNPLTGALVAWVSVPLLSSTEGTHLYIYYGNSAATNQETPAVWDDNYAMVHHLDETSGTHYDSTSNPNDGTAYNLASQDALGKIDGAVEFDAPEGGALIDVGIDASLDVFGPDQDFSIFLWAKRATITAVEGFFSSGSSGANGIYFGSAYTNEDDLKYMSINQSVAIESNANVIADTDWHHVGVTADRDGDLQFWVDGVSIHSEDISLHFGENWNRQDDTYKIGTDRSENNPMDGIIDEVRLSDIVRGAGWIQTSYTNQNDPASFLVIRDQEEVCTTIGAITGPAEPTPVGTEVIVTADLIGSLCDTITFKWGDGNESEPIVDPESKTATGTYTYDIPGVYTITVTVNDDVNGLVCDDEATYQYIVVYDPSGGFVTGGGWIDSPGGAYTADPSLTGKANFGFVSKYKKGATVPTGETEFQFQVADLNFHSDAYEWLVIADARAHYKGTGKINGAGEYKFILTGIDADRNENDNFEVDRFRIKIWEEEIIESIIIEHIIYDNGLDAELDEDNATTEIGGGSIVIHNKKK